MFVVKRSHNPIIVPDKDHYWEASAVFNMSVIKKGAMFLEFTALFPVRQIRMRKPEQISIIGIGKSRDGRHFGEREPLSRRRRMGKYGRESASDF